MKISVENIANEAIRNFLSSNTGSFSGKTIFHWTKSHKTTSETAEVIYLQLLVITQAKLCAA